MTTVVTVTPNPALDQTVRVRNLTLGDVNRAESLEFNAGGKGVNVAGCLADYGIATIATGLLGADDGAAFDAMFADKQIADRFVRIAGRTRINVKLVDDARGETTDINLATSRPAAADVAALERRIAELAAPGRWFVLAGSLPPGVDASFYRRASCRTSRSRISRNSRRRSAARSPATTRSCAPRANWPRGGSRASSCRSARRARSAWRRISARISARMSAQMPSRRGRSPTGSFARRRPACPSRARSARATPSSPGSSRA